MTDRTSSQPDGRAEALVGAYERAGYRRVAPPVPAAGRAVPRPLGRGHPQAHVSHHRRATAASCACGPTSTIPVSARLSRLAAGRHGRGLLLSRPGLSPTAATHAGGDSCRPASNPSAGPTRPRPMPRCWRSGSRPTAHYGMAEPGNPHGRRRAVLRAGRRARSRARLEAAPGEGLQPQDLARARSRSARR